MVTVPSKHIESDLLKLLEDTEYTFRKGRFEYTFGLTI